jgi:hypothetical protein
VLACCIISAAGLRLQLIRADINLHCVCLSCTIATAGLARSPLAHKHHAPSGKPATHAAASHQLRTICTVLIS